MSYHAVNDCQTILVMETLRNFMGTHIYITDKNEFAPGKVRMKWGRGGGGKDCVIALLSKKRY